VQVLCCKIFCGKPAYIVLMLVLVSICLTMLRVILALGEHGLLVQARVSGMVGLCSL